MFELCLPLTTANFSAYLNATRNGLPVSFTDCPKGGVLVGVGDILCGFVRFKQGFFVLPDTARVYQVARE